MPKLIGVANRVQAARAVPSGCVVSPMAPASGGRHGSPLPRTAPSGRVEGWPEPVEGQAPRAPSLDRLDSEWGLHRLPPRSRRSWLLDRFFHWRRENLWDGRDEWLDLDHALDLSDVHGDPPFLTTTYPQSGYSSPSPCSCVPGSAVVILRTSLPSARITYRLSASTPGKLIEKTIQPPSGDQSGYSAIA